MDDRPLGSEDLPILRFYENGRMLNNSILEHPQPQLPPLFKVSMSNSVFLGAPQIASIFIAPLHRGPVISTTKKASTVIISLHVCSIF